jgi:hypothetical protein
MAKQAALFKKTAHEVKCAFCVEYWKWWTIGFVALLGTLNSE